MTRLAGQCRKLYHLMFQLLIIIIIISYIVKVLGSLQPTFTENKGSPFNYLNSWTWLKADNGAVF